MVQYGQSSYLLLSSKPEHSTLPLSHVSLPTLKDFFQICLVARLLFYIQIQFFFFLTCSPECESVTDSQRLRMCKDFLFETDDNVSAVSSPKHQIGFMSRRSSSAQGALNKQANHNEEENLRLGILKIISATKNDGMDEGRNENEAVKRYGGFNGHLEEDVVKGNLLEAVLGHGLKKRYGGFMRRVGRPEWLVDSSKTGGILKSSWENGSGLQKRYGGFMD
uniref:Proenkephalin-A-like n=1 Tax=Fundulus heteroclitus TaxID=8078 RepID=A0A3Q2QCG5_FUNHE